MTDVKNFKIITLGPSGAGKTVFLGSLFKQLSTQGEEGFFLEVADARKIRELNKIYTEVVTDEKWPSGTRNVTEWTFDCCVKNAELDKYKVCEFTYIDYAGGLLTDFQEDQGIFLDFQKTVPEADAVLAIMDGLKLSQFMADDGLRSRDVLIWLHKELPSIMQLVHRCQRDTPVHFVISKWDLLEGRYSIEDVRDRLLEKVPQFQDVVASRKTAGCPQRLIPISSIGPGFASLQADGSMKKTLGAIPVPFQVDIPLACVLLDRVSAYMDILKRHEADAERTVQIRNDYRFLDRLTRPYTTYHNGASVATLLERDERLKTITDSESAVDYMVSIFFKQLKQFERSFPAANLGGNILPTTPVSIAQPISPPPVSPPSDSSSNSSPFDSSSFNSSPSDSLPHSAAAVPIVRQASLIHTLSGHKKAVRSVGFANNSPIAFTVSYDKTARFWSTTSGQTQGVIRGKTNCVAAQLSQNDAYLFVAGQDKSVKIWNAQSGNLASLPLKRHTDMVTALAITPDGTELVSGGRDRRIHVWQIHAKGGQVRQTLDGQQGLIYALALSNDGRVLASGGSDQRVILWDLNQGRILKIFSQTFDYTRALAFSPDGQWLAVAGQDGGLCVWDTNRQTKLFDLEGHAGSVSSVDISPSGRTLVSSGEDAVVKLWDLPTRELIASLSGHRGCVNSVKFSPDSQMVVSGSDDNTAKVWQLV